MIILQIMLLFKEDMYVWSFILPLNLVIMNKNHLFKQCVKKWKHICVCLCICMMYIICILHYAKKRNLKFKISQNSWLWIEQHVTIKINTNLQLTIPTFQSSHWQKFKIFQISFTTSSKTNAKIISDLNTHR